MDGSGRLPSSSCPKQRSPTAAPHALRQDLIKSKAFFRKTCTRVDSVEKERVCVAVYLGTLKELAPF